MYITTTAQMKRIDEMAISDFGIPSLQLMENAAAHVAKAVLCTLEGIENPHVTVICGTGNNGGDGLACSRQLRCYGIRVTTFLVGNPDKQTPDSRKNDAALLACGGEILNYSGQDLPECDLIVDALFGFGLNRSVTGLYRDVIEKINAHGTPVISCDIPSGLNGDTGEVMGTAVKATCSVCFTCVKKGMLEDTASPYIGTLQVVDIGIPKELLRNYFE